MQLESFESLCRELRFRAIDDVEDLQTDIHILKDQLHSIAKEKAHLEINSKALKESKIWADEENNELRTQLKEMRYKLIEKDIEIEKVKIDQLAEYEQIKDDCEEQILLETGEIMHLKALNDELAWKHTLQSAEKTEVVLEASQIKEHCQAL